jgi:hypothetical protein
MRSGKLDVPTVASLQVETIRLKNLVQGAVHRIEAPSSMRRRLRDAIGLDAEINRRGKRC